MEAAADAQPLCFSIADLICFLFLQPLLNWAARIHKLHSTASAASKPPAPRTHQRAEEAAAWGMRAEEVEMVMRSMGLMEEREGGSDRRLEDYLPAGGGDVRCMFEEEEPSVEEVREAFSVFDRNRDGFVDADELGSALRMLGFGEGASPEKCRRMVDAFDDDGDGRIDFLEFAKLVESSLC